MAATQSDENCQSPVKNCTRSDKKLSTQRGGTLLRSRVRCVPVQCCSLQVNKWNSDFQSSFTLFIGSSSSQRLPFRVRPPLETSRNGRPDLPTVRRYRRTVRIPPYSLVKSAKSFPRFPFFPFPSLTVAFPYSQVLTILARSDDEPLEGSGTGRTSRISFNYCRFPSPFLLFLSLF
jgi:hypothetical protein